MEKRFGDGTRQDGAQYNVVLQHFFLLVTVQVVRGAASKPHAMPSSHDPTRFIAPTIQPSYALHKTKLN